jgi:hypothetical protein
MKFAARWQRAMLIVLLWISGVAAEKKGDGHVRVLVYDHARVPAAVMDQAGREAVRIFRTAGIELEWINCADRSARTQCRVLQGEDRLIVNVIPRGKSGESVYGDAFVGEDGTGRYADVFWDRIEGAHQECAVNESRLLGAVAAHEIGHLLLGLRAHTWLGIMAPQWSGEQIRQAGMGRLLFTPEQANRIRERTNKNVLARNYGSEKTFASVNP